MKKCKKCQGRGFVHGLVYKGMYKGMVNSQEVCRKCYGKGVV
ncbi:hypothetical protein [Shouchella clausii]|nr:hypothetical protein [Shouchella clausii]